MLSQQKSIDIKVLVRSKPIDIIKKNKDNIEPDKYINYDIDYINTLGNKSSKNKDDNSYKLDSICFDPTKFSPPDEWSIRLKNRIRNYDVNTYGYMDYLFDNK